MCTEFRGIPRLKRIIRNYSQNRHLFDASLKLKTNKLQKGMRFLNQLFVAAMISQSKAHYSKEIRHVAVSSLERRPSPIK